MPRAPLLPVTQPVTIRMKDGVYLTTTVNPDTGIHEVRCDLCGETIILTKTGHPQRAQTHRHNPKCNKTALKQGLPIVPHISGTYLAAHFRFQIYNTQFSIVRAQVENETRVSPLLRDGITAPAAANSLPTVTHRISSMSAQEAQGTGRWRDRRRMIIVESYPASD